MIYEQVYGEIYDVPGISVHFEPGHEARSYSATADCVSRLVTVVFNASSAAIYIAIKISSGQMASSDLLLVRHTRTTVRIV